MAYSKQITVGKEERVCVNCTHYRGCYRSENVPGESWKKMVPVSFGYCLRNGTQRGPLLKPCKGFESEFSEQ